MEDAPNIEPGRGRLVYDKSRRTIVATMTSQKLKVDAYGLTLMMIAEECENPADLARKTLSAFSGR